MEYGVLGPLEIRTPTGTAAVAGARRRALLAALLAHRGRTVGAPLLVDTLWPDGAPASALHALHSHVSRLRLEHGVPVRAVDGGYRLDVAEPDVDAGRFDAAVRRARDADATRACELLADALDLWRGPAFGGSADEAAVRGEAQRLEEARRAATEELVRRLVAAGRAEDAVPAAEALVGEAPARETAWVALVHALVAAGRPADGVHAYARAVAALDDLGLRPSADLRAAQARALHDDGAARTGAAAPPPAVPPGRGGPAVPVPLTPLVGRDDDLDVVAGLLASARLVTLVGPGGVGKTRLALEALRRRAPAHASGARVVELTTLSDPAGVPAAVLAALGVAPDGAPGPGALRRAGGLDVVVLLDNCEHVVEHVADAVEALLDGGRATVLATSRERLGCAGEHVHVVAPLATDGPDPAARALFLARAHAAGAPASSAALDVHLVDRLVRRLDGLPLAIEMAAARTATLDLPELVATLEQGLPEQDVLALLQDPRRRGAARHRTLGAVIAWSEALLDADERRVLHGWPVFSGPVEAGDAAAVLGAPRDVVESLVRRSLLVVAPGTTTGRTRYRMLHTVRAAVLAEDVGAPHPAARARPDHAAHLARVAAVADAAMRTPGEPDAVARLGSVVPELRAAQAWAREHDPALGARMSTALRVYAVDTLDDEVLGWAARLLPHLDADSGDAAGVHACVASRLLQGGALEAAAARAERALRTAQDDVVRLHALDVLADAAIYDGRLDECARLGRELGEVAAAVGDPLFLCLAITNVALARAYAGDVDGAQAELAGARARIEDRFADLSPTVRGWLEYAAGEIAVESEPDVALRRLRRSVALADAAGNRYLGGVARVSVTSLGGRHGDPREALRAFVDVVRWWTERADRTHLLTTLRNLVDLLLRLEAWTAAAELHAAVSSAGPSVSFGAERQRLDDAAGLLADRLGDAELGEATARGAARDVDAAARAALLAAQALHAG